jgi:cell division protein FtsL
MGEGIQMVPAAARSVAKSNGTTKRAAVKPNEGERKSRKRAGLGKRMVVALLVTGLLIGNLALRSHVINTGYKLHALEKVLMATQTEYDRLQLSIAQLSSLARIEKEAIASLGMMKPKRTEFIMVASTTNRPVLADASQPTTSEKISRLAAEVTARTEDILIGLVSPFVAKWFHNIPSYDSLRVR